MISTVRLRANHNLAERLSERRRSIVVGDTEEAYWLINEIQQQNAALADALRQLVRDDKLGQLPTLLTNAPNRHPVSA